MRVLLVAAVLGVTACGAGTPPGTFDVAPADDATVAIVLVVADPPGDDLADGAGEHVVIRNGSTIRADLGGWLLADAGDGRLPIPPSVQLDPGAELRIHPSCGPDTADAVHACTGEELLTDRGGIVRLLDAGGAEVTRAAYGDAA